MIIAVLQTLPTAIPLLYACFCFKMSNQWLLPTSHPTLIQNQLKLVPVAFFHFCFIDPLPPPSPLCLTSIWNKYNWSILIKLYRHFNWRIWCFYDKQKCKFMLAFIMLIEIFEYGMQCAQIESGRENRHISEPKQKYEK